MKKIAFLSLLILGASCSQVKQQATTPEPINVINPEHLADARLALPMDR